jgi:hypothetical protein
LLLQALAEELPAGTIRYSSKIVSIEEDGRVKVLQLADGSVLRAKVNGMPFGTLTKPYSASSGADWMRTTGIQRFRSNWSSSGDRAERDERRGVVAAVPRPPRQHLQARLATRSTP